MLALNKRADLFRNLSERGECVTEIWYSFEAELAARFKVTVVIDQNLIFKSTLWGIRYIFTCGGDYILHDLFQCSDTFCFNINFSSYGISRRAGIWLSSPRLETSNTWLRGIPFFHHFLHSLLFAKHIIQAPKSAFHPFHSYFCVKYDRLIFSDENGHQTFCSFLIIHWAHKLQLFATY